MGKIDEKYGVCKGYFYVYRANNKLKTLKEAEEHFCKRVEKKSFIDLALQEMYYQLESTAHAIGDFGDFLVLKGIIKNRNGIWKIFSQRFTVYEHKIMAERWVKQSMRIIKAYEEFKDRK